MGCDLVKVANAESKAKPRSAAEKSGFAVLIRIVAVASLHRIVLLVHAHLNPVVSGVRVRWTRRISKAVLIPQLFLGLGIGLVNGKLL